jgi:hypothetical protein
MKAVPACLARLPALALSNARGRPTGLARLVFVVLLLHARGDPPLAWPGWQLLADLTDAGKSSVHKALALLRDRRVIERTRNAAGRRAWRIVLPDTDDDESTQVRVFGPRPFGAPQGGEWKTAFKALVQGLPTRTQTAIAMMLYQFARQPEGTAIGFAEPLPPNQAWIGRLFDTDQSTVARVKRDIIARGLATAGANGLLVFEDPARWPEILNVVEPTPCEPTGELVALESPHEAANGSTYTVHAIAEVEQALAATGWALPADPLAHEIVAEAVNRWGAAATIDRLRVELDGPHPSHALESLGAELGEQFECPYQLIRCA